MDGNLQLFRWEEAYDWLISDIEIIIDIFKLKEVDSKIESWANRSDHEAILTNWKNELMTIYYIQLNSGAKSLQWMWKMDDVITIWIKQSANRVK